MIKELVLVTFVVLYVLPWKTEAMWGWTQKEKLQSFLSSMKYSQKEGQGCDKNRRCIRGAFGSSLVCDLMLCKKVGSKSRLKIVTPDL